jgi:hypothetical protein
MSFAARRWAVGALGTIAALLVLPVTSVGAANGEWEILRWSVEPGDAVAGEVWTVTGIISAPMTTDIITDLELTLTRVEESESCPDLTVPLHVREGYPAVPDPGDGASSTTTSTTAPSTTTTAPLTGGDRYRFRFDVTPRCNGHYQLHVVGTADRPAGEGDVSEPLAMGDPTDPENAVEVNLRPPDVVNTTAAVGGDRAIAVVWQPAEDYASAPPPDFVGYGIDYSVDGGTNWKNGALAEPTAHTTSFPVPATDPAGTYQVRVRGVRRNAAGTLEPALVASGGATALATVEVGEAPPATTARPNTTRRPGSQGVPPPGNGPTTTVDEGFEEELDYSDLEEGDEEATLPDDASSFLDSVTTPGSAILVPFAIAECLAVWAFHLRLLARRIDAAEPAMTPIPIEPFQPGRTP